MKKARDVFTKMLISYLVKIFILKCYNKILIHSEVFLSGGFEVGLNFGFFFPFETLLYASQDPLSCPRICHQSWIANLRQGVGALTNCIYSIYCLNLRERKMFSEKCHLFWGQTYMQIPRKHNFCL